jgi:hypothetical protein
VSPNVKILGQSCGKRDIEAMVARSTEWLRSLWAKSWSPARSRRRAAGQRVRVTRSLQRDDSPAGERGHLHQPVEKNGDLAEENSSSAVRDGGEAVILGRAAEAEVLLRIMNIGAREHGPRLSLLALGPTAVQPDEEVNERAFHGFSQLEFCVRPDTWAGGSAGARLETLKLASALV